MQNFHFQNKSWSAPESANLSSSRHSQASLSRLWSAFSLRPTRGKNRVESSELSENERHRLKFHPGGRCERSDRRLPLKPRQTEALAEWRAGPLVFTSGCERCVSVTARVTPCKAIRRRVERRCSPGRRTRKTDGFAFSSKRQNGHTVSGSYCQGDTLQTMTRLRSTMAMVGMEKSGEQQWFGSWSWCRSWREHCISAA